MMQFARFCRLALCTGMIWPLVAACGKSGSPKVVAAAGVAPDEAHIIIFQSWRSSDGLLDLQVQVRKDDSGGDILRFDDTDSLVVDGHGALTSETEVDPAEIDTAFVPNGLHYKLAVKEAANAPLALQWFRSGASQATVQLLAAAPASFKSYEYCHAVLGQNYALVRFEGEAPTANESVCASVKTDCTAGSCSQVANSCAVHDYRIQIPEVDDELSKATSLRVRVLRTTTLTSLPGFKSAQYARRFDSGDVDTGQDETCVKPN